MPDYGNYIQELFQNSTYKPMNIIGNKLDLHSVESSYEIPFEKMMDYTHAFTDSKNYLIMNLHAQNLTQETYFLKENVCKVNRQIFEISFRFCLLDMF